MEDKKILLSGDFDLPVEHAGQNVVHLRIPKDNADIIRHLPGITHYIVGGPEYVDDHIMSRAPDLRHLVVMGTGTASFVDVHAAQARNILVENTPGINAEAVAEFALGAVIFNLANSFHSQADLLRGGWYQRPHKTLSEVNIGIIGMGNIGQRLARKIRALSSSGIAYFSRSRKISLEKECGIKFHDMPALVASSDVVILCVTYGEDTHQIVNSDVLGKAKPGVMIFNFSNPKTIDPVSLKSNLESGRVSFAFYDGYYNEWINNSGISGDQHGLLALGPDKFVATSHIAAQAYGVINDILALAFQKVASSR